MKIYLAMVSLIWCELLWLAGLTHDFTSLVILALVLLRIAWKPNFVVSTTPIIYGMSLGNGHMCCFWSDVFKSRVFGKTKRCTIYIVYKQSKARILTFDKVVSTNVCNVCLIDFK